ncbi:MAG TPA: hypothetical protein VF492_07070, partial [Verrucomicrobiae bacterium]
MAAKTKKLKLGKRKAEIGRGSRFIFLFSAFPISALLAPMSCVPIFSAAPARLAKFGALALAGL